MKPLRTCPSKRALLTSENSRTASSVRITNAAGEPLRVAWVNHEGQESPWGVMSPGSTQSINTFVGHAWRAYAARGDGALVAEVVVDQPRNQDVRINPCKHSGGAPKGHTAAAESASMFAPINVATDVPFSSAATLFPRCTPEEDLGDAVVPGFWVLCSREVPSSSAVPVMQIGAWQRRGGDGVMFEVPARARVTVAGMRYCIRQGLNLKREPSPHDARPSLPDFTIWAASGAKQIHLATDMLSAAYPRLFLFEGGNFIWPGVAIGHERKVPTRDGASAPIIFKTISLRPLVFEIDNFLKPEECDHIIKLAEPHMGASVVNRMDGDEGKSDTTWRTSTTHFLSRGQTEMAKHIERRIFDATRVPISHGEGTQVLRYEKSQHYYTHHDFFEPSRYTHSKSTLNMIEHGAKNRLATVFWYMSDVEEGGQTNFPRAGGLAPPRNTRECNQGLLVEARRGKVIVFFNMLPSGELDFLSLHAGCSVKRGVKWAANKWLWNKPTHGVWSGDGEDELLLQAAINMPPVSLDESQASSLIEKGIYKGKSDGRLLQTMNALVPDRATDIVLWQVICLVLLGVGVFCIIRNLWSKRREVKKN
eukprot:g3730.t1